MDRETVSYMAQQVLEVGAVYAETFNEHEDDPMEGVYRLGCLCRVVEFFLNDPEGGIPVGEAAEKYEVEEAFCGRAKSDLYVVYIDNIHTTDI